MTSKPRKNSSGGRVVHNSDYARKLSELIEVYKGVPGVSPDKYYRVIGCGSGEFTERQHQLLAQRFNWTAEQLKQVDSLRPSLQGSAVAVGGTTPFDALNVLHRRVSDLFKSAGFLLEQGVAILGTDIRIHLGPLLAYLEALQGSAVVPNQFAEGGQIILDELYVELMAAENQRVDSLVGPDETTRADPIQVWRAHSQRHRIPLATLLSRTEVLPAVLFGDPGAGKSTLLHFALRDVARSLANGETLAANAALPFRISLHELAKDGETDNFEIIPYLVRRILKVTEAEVASWRAALAHLFRNVRPLRLLLLVDGVDEITPQRSVFDCIHQKLEDATSIARMVITSRRAGFLRPVRAFAAFELVELAEPAMARLVQNWFAHVRPQPPRYVQSFTLWLFADPRRQEMAANPCLLSLLCYLNQDRVEDDFIQAVSRAELYRLAVGKLTGDPDRSVPTGLPPALEALAQFALDRYAASNGAPKVLFSRAEVRQFFHDTGPAHRSAAGVWPADFLDDVWLRTRLVSCWDGGEHYHFIHLSFQEYFAARWLVVLPLPEVEALLRKHRYNPYWREVWRFYAGLCRALEPRGDARFAALAKAYCEPRDLYDQTLFWLAPLCAEFGLRDTRPLLGFDLRTELHRLLLAGHNQSTAFIRRMVEVDPEYYLDLARTLLDRQVAGYRNAPSRGKKSETPDEGEVRLMVGVLSGIYHPLALDYQRELIRAEAHYPKLKPTHPSLGPSVISGRNEMLTAALREWLPTAAGPLQRERLVSYLSCTGGVLAGEAILEAARKAARTNRAAKASPQEREEAMEFQCHCLWALTELQDPRAVELAAELWTEPRFRAGPVAEACNFLGDMKHPGVAGLLERWLDEAGDSLSGLVLEPILICLKDWPERPIPRAVEKLLAGSAGDPSVRACAWELVVRRGGVQGASRLRQHLADLMALRRWSEDQMRELVAIAEFVGEQKIPAERELEALLERAEAREEHFLASSLWACLTQWHGVQARLPSQLYKFQRLAVHHL